MNNDFWLGMAIGMVIGLLLGGVIGGGFTYNYVSDYIRKKWGIELDQEPEIPRKHKCDGYDSEL